jgi:hypothetical protein
MTRPRSRAVPHGHGARASDRGSRGASIGTDSTARAWGMGIASLALMSSPLSAKETVDLHVQGDPSARMITTSYRQKARMIASYS